MTKTASFATNAKFHFIALAPFFAAAVLIAFLFGCQQKPKEVKDDKPTVSMENLQFAYNKEMGFSRMYTLFAQRAMKEKNTQMAALYFAIAKSEEFHAASHAALMRKQGIEVKTPQFDSLTVGNVMQTLKMGLSSEDIEIGSMYPNIIKSADAEKFKEAQTQFEQCRDGDARQEELLKAAMEKNGKIAKTPFFVCPGCGYIFDSDKTEECPVCKATKDKFTKI
jgi:rubrerythrin